MGASDAVTTNETPAAAAPRREQPDRFIAAALRLIACPCGAPLHETLRPGSPAAALLDLVRVIDHHARRPLSLHPVPCECLSADEHAIVGLIACYQSGRVNEACLRGRTLVRPAGQAALQQAAATLSDKLTDDGVRLPPPGPVAPAGQPRPLRLVAEC